MESFYPDSKVLPLSQPISDHVPYVVQVNTHVSRSQIFIFENFWTNFDGFNDTVELHWHSTPFYGNSTKTFSIKFKKLWRSLKAWSKGLSQLSKNIHNYRWVIAFMDGIEYVRPLSLVEKNFREIVKSHLTKLLEAKRIYWKQRATSRFVQFGEENTKVFRTLATYSRRKNHISQLQGEDGSNIIQHSKKVEMLWESFKSILGSSACTSMYYDLATDSECAATHIG
jgi:uncharacterized protein (DUF2384 family)